MSSYAPVAIFGYKRPSHLEATLRSLERCVGFNESAVIFFGDGPKFASDREAVDSTRRIAKECLGSLAEFHFNDDNRGLAQSIIGGVDEVMRRFDRVVVVEDDLEIAPNFLTFMNEALSRYQHEAKVFQVSGHMFDVPEFRGRRAALFLPFTTTWGWATWRRAWDKFDPLAVGWESLLVDDSLRRRFNLGGTYDYSSMIAQQMAGFRDSWGVRWYWSTFCNEGLACFPPVSLVRNTGMDGSGTHGRGILRRFRGNAAFIEIGPITFPSTIAVEKKDMDAVARAIWRHNGGFIGAAVDRIRYLMQQRSRGAAV